MALSVAATTAVLAASEGESKISPFIPHTAEIIVGAVGFLVLLFLLAKFAYPMFEKTYEERTAAIEGGIERAEKAQGKAGWSHSAASYRSRTSRATAGWAPSGAETTSPPQAATLSANCPSVSR